MADAGLPVALLEILEEARTWGFLGPGPVGDHIVHATAFAALIGAPPGPGRVAELGSGGGVPGLVLIAQWPETTWTLVEANGRRARHLEAAVTTLGWADRVTVWHGRAEDLGRGADARGAFELVVARGFGPPAVTAECGAPLLRLGGRLVVSEPPAPDPDRWPSEGLAKLGFGPPAHLRSQVHAVCLSQLVPCPGQYPRRAGIPTKRPLF